MPAKPSPPPTVGLSMSTTPAKPASTVITSGPCSGGRSMRPSRPGTGTQASSAPPTRKAATHTLLM
ncbi:hypothetical protein FQZ97_581160 [compost metagenome]